MNEFLAYVMVFLAAAVPWLEVLLVVPAGIVAGLAPGPTAVIGALGNISTLVPLVLAGDRVRARWRGRRSPDVPAETEPVGDLPRSHGPDGAAGPPPAEDGHGNRGRGARARRVFDRFGLPGLALLGPLLTGVHVAGLVALAAGAERRHTLAWLIGGVVVWSALAAIATVFGLDILVDPDDLPRLLG